MKVEEIRQSLLYKTVGIAGCGGLGSNCAVALARTGIGKLVLVDFDRVEASNLNRQYFFREQIGMFKAKALRDNIMDIDDSLIIDAHVDTLDVEGVLKYFSGCDLIVEAFDHAEAKQMIIETVLGELPEIRIISGQGLAGFGNNESLVTRRSGNLFIIGDGETEVSDEMPPLGPRVAVVANMQANLALELLLEKEENGDHPE